MQTTINIKSSAEKHIGQHFYWLDLIRFLAAFLVMACHYRGAFLPEFSDVPISERNIFSFSFYCITRLGEEAVLLFFVLSGFLVGGKLIERVQYGTFNLQSYALDRSVRILLPLISALILSVIVNKLTDKPVEWLTVLGNLLSLQGIWCEPQIEVLWSLSYEVWFYILGGGIAILSTTKKTSAQIYAVIIILISLLVFTRLAPLYLFIWIMGAIAYALLPSKGNKIVLIISGILTFVTITMLELNFEGNFSLDISKWLPTSNRKALSILFAFFTAVFLNNVVLFKPKRKIWLIVNKIGTWLAAFSYTLYLVHVPLMNIFKWMGAERAISLSERSVSIYFGLLFCGLLGSYLIYLLFEKHTGEIKKLIRTYVLSSQN